jgi:hypothetical protein
VRSRKIASSASLPSSTVISLTGDPESAQRMMKTKQLEVSDLFISLGVAVDASLIVADANKQTGQLDERRRELASPSSSHDPPMNP